MSGGQERPLKKFLQQHWLDLFPEDKRVIYHFLYKAQLKQTLTTLFQIDLNQQTMDVPWHLFVHMLIEEPLKVPQPILLELNNLLTHEKFIKKQGSDLGQLVSELKTKKRYTFLQNLQKKKSELLASAQIAKSEQLMDQYLVYMSELQKIVPGEYNVSNIISDQEKERAVGILQKRSKKNISESQDQHQTQEELLLIDTIKNQAQAHLRTKKVQPSDFAYLLRSIGETQMAIDFIKEEAPSPKNDWQYLDYLFHGRQYLSVLSHCTLLQTKYSDSPEALFSVHYIQAIALWELGEKDRAIDLMSQISTMRPGFKSATELLAQWKEESFE